jgi:hypothetical protein
LEALNDLEESTNLLGRNVTEIFGPISEVRIEFGGDSSTGVANEVEQRIRERIDGDTCLGRESEVKWHKTFAMIQGHILFQSGVILPVRSMASGIIVGDLIFTEPVKLTDSVKSEEPDKMGANAANKTADTNNTAADIDALRESASNGDAKAQCDIGDCYYKGNGVPKDYTNAFMWFRKSAEQGNADAQRWLGFCCYNGIGVQKDRAEAVKWYRKSAEQGSAVAQCHLGYCCYHGIGMQADQNEGLQWFRKAAAQGYILAQDFLQSVAPSNTNADNDVSASLQSTNEATNASSSMLDTTNTIDVSLPPPE